MRCTTQVYYNFEVSAEMLAAARGGGGQSEVASDRVHLAFDVHKYTGDMHLVARHSARPLKVMAPSTKMLSETKSDTVSLCDVQAGSIMYLGIRGAKTCAVFDVTPRLVASAECNGEFSALETELEAAGSGTSRRSSTDDDDTDDLTMNQFAYATCDAYSWRHFRLTFSDEEKGNNIIFEASIRVVE